MADKNLVPSNDEVVFTTSQGIKFRVHKVSRVLIETAASKIILPKPPKVFIADKGREEENPLDPDYREAVAEAINKRGTLTLNIILSLGVELIPPLPKGINGPDDEDWSAIVEDIGLEVPPPGVKGVNSRYVAWLKYIALPDASELMEIMKLTARQTYTLEADVEAALTAFPGVQTRGADTPTPNAEAS